MRSIHKNYQDIMANRTLTVVLFVVVVSLIGVVTLHTKAEIKECKEMTMLEIEQKLYRHLLHGNYKTELKELGYEDTK